jgi:2-phosphosulfolactate phosphatase
MNSLDVALNPSEFPALKQRDLTQTTCIVFDILRATTSMTTALANGAEAIIPVSEISEAIAIYEKNQNVLLAGERHGLRILKNQTGSVDFDLGNSPREFTAEKVKGKTIAMTTTNGTRALQACAGAKQIFIGAFANLAALANWISANKPENLLLVCAGTFEEAAYEDILAAGALIDSVLEKCSAEEISDSAHIARQVFQLAKSDLLKAMQFSKNARRLLANPDLCADVPFSLQHDTVNFIAEKKAGIIRRVH